MPDPNKPRYVRVTLDVPTYEGELPLATWMWEDLLGTMDPVWVVSECDVPDDDEPTPHADDPASHG